MEHHVFIFSATVRRAAARRHRARQLYNVTQWAGWFVAVVCIGSGLLWTVGAWMGWWR
jgi:hypothetical protein